MDRIVGDTAGVATASTGVAVFISNAMGWLQNVSLTGIEFIDAHTGFFSILLMAIGLVVQYRFKKKAEDKE